MQNNVFPTVFICGIDCCLMNVYAYTYIFDVMKIVYSILHALRAIVCIAHGLANTVRLYKIAVTL